MKTRAPIETAPKDGTAITLLAGEDEYPGCRWHTFADGSGAWKLETYPDGTISCLDNPTHWTP